MSDGEGLSEEGWLKWGLQHENEHLWKESREKHLGQRDQNTLGVIEIGGEEERDVQISFRLSLFKKI